MENLHSKITKTFVTVIDKNYTYVFVSPSYVTEKGYKTEEIIGSSLKDNWSEKTFKTKIKPNIDAAFKGVPQEFKGWFDFSTINKKYYRVRYIPLLNKLGEVERVLIVTTDLTHSKEIQSSLYDELYKDFLTGCYNKKTFEEDIEEIISKEDPFQVVYLDLDNFKKVNDTFGHDSGDFVLKNIVDLIRKHIRSRDRFYRIGGDEFALIIANSLNPDILKRRMQDILDHLKEAPFNKGYKVGISIGVVDVSKKLNVSSQKIKDTADKLLYNSKKQGKNRYTYKKI